MRERWSRRLAVLTGLLVLLLSYTVATVRNPADPPAPSGVVAPPSVPAGVEPDLEIPALVRAGRQVYAKQGCARCHSIAGEGNLRSPLDGVGEWHTAEEIRDWIVAPPELEDMLPRGAFLAKQAYGRMPASDLDALVAFLRSLWPPPEE